MVWGNDQQTHLYFIDNTVDIWCALQWHAANKQKSFEPLILFGLLINSQLASGCHFTKTFFSNQCFDNLLHCYYIKRTYANLFKFTEHLWTFIDYILFITKCLQMSIMWSEAFINTISQKQRILMFGTCRKVIVKAKQIK